MNVSFHTVKRNWGGGRQGAIKIMQVRENIVCRELVYTDFCIENNEEIDKNKVSMFNM